MKLIVLAVATLLAVTLAAPAEKEPTKKILHSEFKQQPEGGFQYGFETEDGIKREENGELKTVNDEENKPHVVVVVRGSFSYTNPEGQLYSVTYYADETGYHAESNDIPKEAAQA